MHSAQSECECVCFVCSRSFVRSFAVCLKILLQKHEILFRRSVCVCAKNYCEICSHAFRSWCNLSRRYEFRQRIVLLSMVRCSFFFFFIFFYFVSPFDNHALRWHYHHRIECSAIVRFELISVFLNVLFHHCEYMCVHRKCVCLCASRLCSGFYGVNEQNLLFVIENTNYRIKVYHYNIYNPFCTDF